MAPGAVPYVPGLHCWHVAWPLCPLYVPATHGVHDESPLALRVPGPHRLHTRLLPEPKDE